jgi:hypothetical protein
MAGNLYQILPGLFPYAVPAFFSLLVAIAWVVAFAKLKQIGALVLAFASLVGSILSMVSGLLWIGLQSLRPGGTKSSRGAFASQESKQHPAQ